MFAEERREMILSILKSEGRVFAKGLSERFNISIDSIRRDLTILEQRGFLKRTHGGAISLSKVRKSPIDNKIRYSEGTEHQNAVASLAAQYIEEGDTIFIGGASIHYVLLKYLPLDKNFTVITNSLVIAERLKSFRNIETYITCGKIRDDEDIVDNYAIDFIKSLRIDAAFLTGGGVSAEHGISNSVPDSSAFQRAVAMVSTKRICLANFDKIGTEYFSRTLEAKELDLIITDWEAQDSEIEKLRQIGVNVIVAKEQ